MKNSEEVIALFKEQSEQVDALSHSDPLQCCNLILNFEKENLVAGLYVPFPMMVDYFIALREMYYVMFPSKSFNYAKYHDKKLYFDYCIKGMEFTKRHLYNKDDYFDAWNEYLRDKLILCYSDIEELRPEYGYGREDVLGKLSQNEIVIFRAVYQNPIRQNFQLMYFSQDLLSLDDIDQVIIDYLVQLKCIVFDESDGDIIGVVRQFKRKLTEFGLNGEFCGIKHDTIKGALSCIYSEDVGEIMQFMHDFEDYDQSWIYAGSMLIQVGQSEMVRERLDRLDASQLTVIEEELLKDIRKELHEVRSGRLGTVLWLGLGALLLLIIMGAVFG